MKAWVIKNEYNQYRNSSIGLYGDLRDSTFYHNEEHPQALVESYYKTSKVVRVEIREVPEMCPLVKENYEKS